MSRTLPYNITTSTSHWIMQTYRICMMYLFYDNDEDNDDDIIIMTCEDCAMNLPRCIMGGIIIPMETQHLCLSSIAFSLCKWFISGYFFFIGITLLVQPDSLDYENLWKSIDITLCKDLKAFQFHVLVWHPENNAIQPISLSQWKCLIISTGHVHMELWIQIPPPEINTMRHFFSMITFLWAGWPSTSHSINNGSLSCK